MGKTLILTEKPSVAREYAATLKVQGNKQGYIENEEYVITWCVGHLVEMAYPEQYDAKYKSWKLEDLPFLPDEYMYRIIPAVKAQYKVVHTQMHRKDIDRMLYCGDAGREGEVIGRLIRNLGGIRKGIKEYRVWIDSYTEAEILRGIREAKPLGEYDRMADAGMIRGIEDYAMGINFSRALSCKYGKAFNDAIHSEKWKSIAVGRVMTCVLGMVVEREQETDARKFVEDLKKETVVIKHIEAKESNRKAPLLFNLAELQAECSKRFKISPNDTLEIAQALYEKKLTTYPRTDARVISTAVAKEILTNLSGLKQLPYASEYVVKIEQEKLYSGIDKTSYTDDSKITDHYAIIPTGQISAAASLNELQGKVYELIVRRFLSIFYPSAVYANYKLEIQAGRESFFASCKKLKSRGYLEVAESKADEENENRESKEFVELLSRYKEGQKLQKGEFKIAEGKTSPPKRYDSGSLILAMENAGKLIEDEVLREQIKGAGIGTSATRAAIIEKLVKNSYLILNPKTQILSPHGNGEAVYDIVLKTLPDFLSPELTARWETKLSMIEQGTLSKEIYLAEIETYVREKIAEIKG